MMPSRLGAQVQAEAVKRLANDVILAKGGGAGKRRQ